MGHPPSPCPAPDAKPRLVERVQQTIRTKHYSRSTENAYWGWIRRYVLYHEMRHPDQRDARAIGAFLAHPAIHDKVTARTQNQALHALLLLYREVLQIDLPRIPHIAPAKTPRRLPVVLTREEVGRVLGRLDGLRLLMAPLLYGSGLRLTECCRLRVKDVDFASPATA